MHAEVVGAIRRIAGSGKASCSLALVRVELQGKLHLRDGKLIADTQYATVRRDNVANTAKKGLWTSCMISSSEAS